MERTIEVRHVTVEVKRDFESFTEKIEHALGRFDPALIKDLATSPAEAQKRLEKMAGEEGLMLFDVQDHGALLNILGSPKKAKQYVVGNPLIAMTMTRHDIRAALYAPLRILVYEADDHTTRVEFDQPSSLFGQFEHPEVASVGLSLDRKLANLIKKADEVAGESGKGAVAS
jgi:uncharacterized protein (DUF302 family)